MRSGLPRGGGALQQSFLQAGNLVARLAPAMAGLLDRLRMRIDWATFEAELVAWHAAGMEPTFWWRDDDVIAYTHELQRLLALAE